MDIQTKGYYVKLATGLTLSSKWNYLVQQVRWKRNSPETSRTCNNKCALTDRNELTRWDDQGTQGSIQFCMSGFIWQKLRQTVLQPSRSEIVARVLPAAEHDAPVMDTQVGRHTFKQQPKLKYTQ